MLPLSDVDWGPTDAAEPDSNFLNKFVEPKQIRLLLHQDYWIITGEKGSGKTALRKALCEKYSDNFSGIVTLDFDALEYSSILCNLNNLAQITSLPRLSLLTNYWQYVLIVEGMKDFVRRNRGITDASYALIHNYLTKNGLIEGSHLRLFLSLIAKCWTFVDSYTKPDKYHGAQDLPVLPSNLAPAVVEQVRDYPIFHGEFIETTKTFSKALRQTNETILVVLDGFDRFENINNIKPEVNLVFESLIEAVYCLSINAALHDVLKVKALIPHDRFLSINLRDTDKFDNKQKSIKWSYGSLQEFLSRRAALHPRLSHQSGFDKLWEEVMPRELQNPYYKIKEKSYDYLLRHTMYRPRQLQVHLRKLSGLYHGQIIEPNMIPKAVRESCRKLVSFYVQEYFIDHPKLEKFIGRFRNKVNIMFYQEFRAIVADALQMFDAKEWTVEGKIDALYEMGFFGIIQPIKDHQRSMDDEYEYLPPRKAGVEPYRTLFYYKNPRAKIINQLHDQDLIAIHPMFFDMADMTPHPDMIVG